MYAELEGGVVMDISFDVIVPIYNAAKTLERMLDSFLCQGYENFRLILVNDGSNDLSRDICEKYCAKTNKILLIDQKNQGPGVARKNGFKQSNADYIMFCDADDYIEGNLFEDVSSIIREKGIDAVEFGFQKVNNAGVKLRCKKLFEERIINNCLEHYIKQVNTTNYLWNKVFKRDLVSHNDFINLFYSEDACFLTNFFDKCQSYVVIDNIYYNYVISDTSACGSDVNLRRLDMIKADKYIINVLKNKHPELLPYASASACSHAAYLYALFKNAGKLTSILSKELKCEFKKNYKLLNDKKNDVYKVTSFKRRMSIEIFHIFPKLYTFIVRMGG